jgi:hypothetical protein
MLTTSISAMVIMQGGLPMYIATRGLYNLRPPTVFVPPCIRDDVEDLLRVHRRMSQIELKVELVALDLGMDMLHCCLECFLLACSL